MVLAETPIASQTALTISPATTATVGQKVSLNATVTPAKVGNLVPKGSASFYNGTVALGTAAPGATFSTSFNKAGVLSLKAKYRGNTNFAASTSAPSTLTIQ